MEITIEKKLEAIKHESDNNLIKCVIDDALDMRGDEALTYLEDVRNYGCQSGMVSGLVYYHDTHEFFLEFVEEIQNAFFDYSKQAGEQPKIKPHDLRNWFAWFAYEWAVDQVMTKLENGDFTIKEEETEEDAEE